MSFYLQKKQVPCPSCRGTASVLSMARILTLLPFGVVRSAHVSFVLPADLSSYTPKHSVKFSEWQEQKYEEMPASERPLPKEADSHGNQVMVRLQSSLWLCPVPLLSGSWISLGSGWDRTCLPLNTCVAHLAGQGKQRSTQASTAPSSPASPGV